MYGDAVAQEDDEGEPQWASLLRNFVESDEGNTLRPENEIEVEIQRRLTDIFLERKQSLLEEHPSWKTIPKFFKSKPVGASLAAKIRHEARMRSLQSRNALLLDESELEKLWFLLGETTSPPFKEEEDPAMSPVSPSVGSGKINYDDFCQVCTKAQAAFGDQRIPFFTPSTFLKFKADQHGRIDILPLFHYIMRKVSMMQTRIYLSYHDSMGDGYLREQDLEGYLSQIVPALPQLCKMEREFETPYRQIAVRKFFFFCDPKKTGKIRIKSLLTSPVLTELFELRQDDETVASSGKKIDRNWFSLPSAKRVYDLFLYLDTNMNGTLSKSELKQYGSGGLTDIFIDRVFEQHLSKQRRGHAVAGEMDFLAFLDFVLAMENKKAPEALAYFFAVLDIHQTGELTVFNVHAFFRVVHEKWIAGGNYELSAADVRDEIWDMVKPRDPLKITLDDLIASKVGDTVVSMLIDVNAFWAYDNRESLAQQEPS
eukprot:jgi/Mesvir1/5189/Mv15322-RA.1